MPGRARDAVPRGFATALALAAAASIGALVGVGVFTMVYGEGTAYLSHEPEACINCHVMQGHFDSWLQSSHRHVAVCNDCHLPAGFVGKWFTKADNGLLHSIAFTTGEFPDPLRIKPRNARRAQEACQKCHAALVHAMAPHGGEGEIPACVHCHSSVGHALR